MKKDKPELENKFELTDEIATLLLQRIRDKLLNGGELTEAEEKVAVELVMKS